MNTTDVLDVLSEIVTKRTSLVTSFGRTGEYIFRKFPDQTLFLDSMGSVTSIASGIALGVGESNPVIALDTDGSHLMGITLLSALSLVKSDLSNLTIIVLDNGIYESGGGLSSHNSALRWSKLGEAWGIEIHEVDDLSDLRMILLGRMRRLAYIVAKIENSDEQIEFHKDMDGIESKYKFVRHLQSITGRILVHPAIKG